MKGPDQGVFEGFGNRLVAEGVPGDNANHLNRRATEMAGQTFYPFSRVSLMFQSTHYFSQSTSSQNIFFLNNVSAKEYDYSSFIVMQNLALKPTSSTTILSLLYDYSFDVHAILK